MTSAAWAKRAGQAELRDNLRAAMRESGRSQRNVAAAADVPLTHVTGALAGDCWLRRDAAAALAAELKLSLDELVGGSIFKDEISRYDDFPHPADVRAREQQAQRAAVAAGQDGDHRALCCVCGALRKTGEWTGDEPDLTEGGRVRGRRLVELLCFECDTVTEHAVLTTGPDRDSAEQAQRAPSHDQASLLERDALIARLSGFNVDVHLRAWGEGGQRDGILLHYRFDQSKSRWRIEVEEFAPARMQVDGISEIWGWISTDDHPVDHPHNGVTLSATQSCWDDAVNELVTDLRRFTDLERGRLVQHHRGAAQVRRYSVEEPPSDR